ncbi:hypothetical protein SBDP2_1990006 [Syntrophobacter sp. SbD2]|nr:hypothetical protein SBDP2_1990006 [Syntrophobacter sp. SbD2]
MVAGKHERQMNTTASIQGTMAALIDELFFIAFFLSHYFSLGDALNGQ